MIGDLTPTDTTGIKDIRTLTSMLEALVLELMVEARTKIKATEYENRVLQKMNTMNIAIKRNEENNFANSENLMRLTADLERRVEILETLERKS